MRFQKLLLLFLICLGLAFFAFDHRMGREASTATQLLASGNSEDAYTAFLKIQQIEPWRKLDWRTLAYRFGSEGKPEKTIGILEPWIKSNRLEAEDAVVLARAYSTSGSQQDAINLLSNAALSANDPDEAQKILPALEKYLREDRQFDRAYASLEHLNSLGMNTPETDLERILVGGIVFPGEIPGEVIISEDTPEWLKYWASAMIAANSEPDETRRYLEFGRAYGQIGEWDLAEYEFSKAVETSPDLADAWGLLGEARQQQGKQAEDEVNRALALSPDSPAIRLMGALFYRRQHNTAKAVELLEKNIAGDPTSVIWHLEMGNTLAEGGRLNEAVLEFQKAVDLAPNDPAGYSAAARFSIQYDYQLEDVGLKAAGSVIQLSPDSAEGYDLKGQVLYNLGRPDEALEAFNTALEKDDAYAAAWLHLGQLLLDKGDRTRALEALQEAAALGGRSYEASVAARLLKQYYGLVPEIP